jgi:hypothetical protein
MNNEDNNVKIYACNAATSSSNTSINNTNATDTGAIITVLNIKINEIKLKMIMCPAVMFANKRINRAIGFARIPISSTGIIIGNNQKGTPGVANTCFQYSLFPFMFVIMNVINAKVIVKEMFPVKLAEPGKNGIKPKRLFTHIKKNTVRR